MQSTSPTSNMTLKSKYKVLEVIGDGNYATVRRCMHRETRKPFALKVFSKKKLDESDVELLRNEVRVI